MKRIASGIGLWLVLMAGADAAGIDCAAARTVVDSTICARPELRLMDRDVAGLYRQLQREPTVDGVALRQAQRRWLTQRDACGAEADCLLQRHVERSAALDLQLHVARAYQPDGVDRAAMRQLRDAVAAAMARDEEFPLETALAAFALPPERVTRFHNVRPPDAPEDADARFPSERPAGVTPDEWRVLRASQVEGGGESGNAGYELIDLDGDGDRDLLIDSYQGGTGLWSYAIALERRGGRFVAPARARPAAGEAGDESLYAINGRGGNQQATWVRLQGRVYTALRDSVYGSDRLYLLRPLRTLALVPRLTVDYRYHFTVPRQQRPEAGQPPYLLDEQRLAALNQAVADPDAFHAGPPADGPLCPIPPGTPEENQADWYGFGPGHYSFEVIADLPVWLDGACHVGQLIDWFGQYDRTHGLSAQLQIKKPGSPGQETLYELSARRSAIRVGAELAVYPP
ncbi:lysozyme inhibitor LprI family protein [Chitiniphilus shinanonensis]|uniref:lysozyme inhibitor LprI family protein n=1 Tax=Chitiniphilus shinanonensis TaxID=553088 RepID=UPI003042639C